MSLVLFSRRLILRTPQLEDLPLLQSFEMGNRSHLAKWETLPHSSDQEIVERLTNWKKECETGNALRFFLFSNMDNQPLIGMCNFTPIMRGAFQACYLGYKIDSGYQGQGLMFEALQHSIAYLFEQLNLHRIMANYMPTNTRSASLLSRLGFEIEGYAKHYLFINSQWEDHVLTALSYERWKSLKHDLHYSYDQLSTS